MIMSVPFSYLEMKSYFGKKESAGVTMSTKTNAQRLMRKQKITHHSSSKM